MSTSNAPLWPSHASFLNTQWTLVLRAQGSSDSSLNALDDLFRSYWPPLYAFLRRSGCSPQDAQDLTQAFFERWIEKGALGNALPEHGKFRSYLLGALKHFLLNQREKAHAQKRGGGQPLLPLDFAGAEQAFLQHPSAQLGPEQLFDRAWAEQLLQQVHDSLRTELQAAGKAHLYEQLRFCVLGTPAGRSYQEMAEAAGLSEGAFKVAVHRFRDRFRDHLRSAVARTVDSEAEIDPELRHLIEVLSA